MLVQTSSWQLKHGSCLALNSIIQQVPSFKPLYSLLLDTINVAIGGRAVGRIVSSVDQQCVGRYLLDFGSWLSREDGWGGCSERRRESRSWRVRTTRLTACSAPFSGYARFMRVVGQLGSGRPGGTG